MSSLMEHYVWLKHLHTACVGLSVAGFVARWLGRLAGAGWVRSRVAKILPHVVDTVLLLSAVLLAAGLQMAPGSHAWLTAKVLGLVAYIVLGTLAIKRATTRTGIVASGVGALLVVAYIVAVALTKQPWPFA